MRYLLRRLGLLLITGWAALTINYVLPQLVPGDPVSVMLARYQGRLSPQAADALREAFGLNTGKSWFGQYLDYWWRMFTGDFGLSLGFFPAPVSEILGQGDSLDARVGRRYDPDFVYPRNAAWRILRLVAQHADW